MKRLNKKKSKDLTVNDLQHEINIVKQEISELKHNNKSDNNHIKPKIDKWDKTFFRPYIFTRFSLWSLTFFFTAFSP